MRRVERILNGEIMTSPLFVDAPQRLLTADGHDVILVIELFQVKPEEIEEELASGSLVGAVTRPDAR